MSLNKICVIAASNSTTKDGQLLDYIQLASIAAERVRYFLDLETYIITSDVDVAANYPIFSKIIHSEAKQISNRTVIAGNDNVSYKWLNDSRVDAFELTKGLADRILMIDADLMVSSNSLSNWLNCDSPFMMFGSAFDVTGFNTYKEKYLQSNDIRMQWATAICWDQSEEAQIIFETAKMVRDNYPFYSLVTGMPKTLYRNDVAFSIACHLHNVPVIDTPKLYNLPPGAEIYFHENKGKWLIIYNNRILHWDHDVHVINKKYAIDNELMAELRLKNVKA